MMGPSIIGGIPSMSALLSAVLLIVASCLAAGLASLAFWQWRLSRRDAGGFALVWRREAALASVARLSILVAILCVGLLAIHASGKPLPSGESLVALAVLCTFFGMDSIDPPGRGSISPEDSKPFGTGELQGEATLVDIESRVDDLGRKSVVRLSLDVDGSLVTIDGPVAQDFMQFWSSVDADDYEFRFSVVDGKATSFKATMA